MIKKIISYIMLINLVDAFIPLCNPNVCIFNTGPGQANLLTLATNKMLKNNNALVICNDNVSDDIKEIINCHKLKTVSEYQDLDDMLTEAATELLNEHPVYRVMENENDINNIELSVYKKWGMEVLIFPGVINKIEEY